MYLNDMLGSFAEEAESIAGMAYDLKDDINYVREYAYGVDTDNYYDYYDYYKVSVAVTNWGEGGREGRGHFHIAVISYKVFDAGLTTSQIARFIARALSHKLIVTSRSAWPR